MEAKTVVALSQGFFHHRDLQNFININNFSRISLCFNLKCPPSFIFHPPGCLIYQLLFANCQLKDSAFAAVTCDGHVVTWGGRHGFGRGGNSLAVQRQLVDVQRLSATDGAFAALLGDGRVPWKPMIFCVFFCFCFFKSLRFKEKWGGKKTVFGGRGFTVRSCFFSFFCG